MFVYERDGKVKNVSKGFVLMISWKDRVSINQDGKSVSGFLGEDRSLMLHIQNWRCLLDIWVEMLRRRMCEEPEWEKDPDWRHFVGIPPLTQCVYDTG